MKKSYYNVDPERKVKEFLSGLNDARDFLYLILNTQPESFVDARSIVSFANNGEEKLKSLKKPLPHLKDPPMSKIQKMMFLLDSATVVVKIEDKLYDFKDAMQDLIDTGSDILKENLKYFFANEGKDKDMTINEKEKISAARKHILNNNFCSLAVIDEKRNIIGEIRLSDFLLSELYMKEKPKSNTLSFGKRTEIPIQNLPISDIMNNNPKVFTSTSKIREAALAIIERKSLSVIVVDPKEGLKAISYLDLLRYFRNYHEE